MVQWKEKRGSLQNQARDNFATHTETHVVLTPFELGVANFITPIVWFESQTNQQQSIWTRLFWRKPIQ